MASFDPKKHEGKASSLADAVTAHRPARPDSEGKKAAPAGVRGLRRSGMNWRTVVVDLILLAVLIGLVTGGIFAYRAVRELYAPTWETREVVFRVEMTGLDLAAVKYGQDGRPTITGHPLWSSDRTDADLLGTVTDVRTVLVTGEDGSNTLSLYLTVEATALYREGKGYRMGATMLLAGMENTFMAQGLVAEGTVISMHEKIDETEAVTEAGTVFAEPEDVRPEARKAGGNHGQTDR